MPIPTKQHISLTENQIQELYVFTRKHFVEHYDLQTELVDHLANDIEHMWQENSKFSFEDAKNKAFKKFGIFGFMNAIEQKQKALSKSYAKLLFQHAKAWFTLPKLLSIIVMFLFTYTIITLPKGNYIFLSLVLVLAVLEGYLAFQLKKRVKQRYEKNEKKWMLEDIIFQVATTNAFILGGNFFHIFSHFTDKPLSNFWAIVVALLFTLTVIYSYVTLRVLPAKADELLNAHYPEYKLT